MSHNDYQMALLLQRQFEQEANIDTPVHNLVYTEKKKKHAPDNSKCLVDPSWEVIDPTPDIHVLFMAFNEKYFWNKLLTVCVDWSKRMTTCAGVCSYQGRGGMCRITLSEPLLKLRPRKDLVETLLHEMIHAYLFVTNNNRDRDGHGPEFHKHMYRINGEAGTNITVYHDFHDEVRLYKQHWWRCNGPCQKRKPYFGMVRRATNRAPGHNDFWWGEHQRTCGGTFIKVQEPEKPAKKKSGKENKPAVNPKNDIRVFYPVVNGKNPTSTVTSAVNGVNKNNPDLKTSSINGLNNVIGIGNSSSTSTNNITGFKDLNATRPKNALSNSSSTIVINKKQTKNSTQDHVETPKSSLVQQKSTTVSVFSGTGQALGNPSTGSSDYAAVRNHWINKFPSSSQSTPKPTKRPSNDISGLPESPKRAKPSFDDVTCPVCFKKFPANEVNAHLDHCLEQSDVAEPENHLSKCPICDKEFNSGIINKHVEECVNEVFNKSDEPTDDNLKTAEELIPCLVCNKKIPRGDLNSHLDECMGSDNIFNNSSDNTGKSSDFNEDTNLKNEQDKKYPCPVCFELIPNSEMGEHLDRCLLNDGETSNGNGILNSFFDEPF